jgi:hypothetical protein
MSKANPHLIDDIGLTRRQVEAEIAKPFWQVKANAAMTPDRQFPRAAVVRRHLHLPEFAGPASRSA